MSTVSHFGGCKQDAGTNRLTFFPRSPIIYGLIGSARKLGVKKARLRGLRVGPPGYEELFLRRIVIPPSLRPRPALAQSSGTLKIRRCRANNRREDYELT